MINKIAEQVKEAEVRGVLAAFVDAELIKVASEDAFDNLCATVAQNLGSGMDYNLEKIAATTEAVLRGGMQKTATQQKTAHEVARNAALGELLLMKTAGQIDDATFAREARGLMKMAGPRTDAVLGGLRSAWGGVKNAFAPRELRSALNRRAAYKELAAQNPGYTQVLDAIKSKGRREAMVGAGKAALAYGGTLGGAGYLGKSLYDSYAE